MNELDITWLNRANQDWQDQFSQIQSLSSISNCWQPKAEKSEVQQLKFYNIGHMTPISAEI